MSNSLDSDLIVDVLSNVALTKLNTALAPLRVFSTDFSAQRATGPRQTIQVELVTDAGEILTNPTNFEVTAVTNRNVPVTGDHLSRPVGLTVQDLNQGHRLETKAEQCANTVANAVQDACFSLITLANYNQKTPVEVAGEANLDHTHLKALWAGISDGNMKNIVLSGVGFSKFLPTDTRDFDITRSDVNTFGFDNFKYSNRMASAGEGIVGFSCDPQAMAVAAMLPADPGDAKERDYIASQTVFLDKVGVTVEFNVWFSRATRGHWLSYDVVFGAAVADRTALVPLVDTTASTSS